MDQYQSEGENNGTSVVACISSGANLRSLKETKKSEREKYVASCTTLYKPTLATTSYK
jgi:hypothetical protein